MFKSDKEEITFDINHIRINEYDRSDLLTARKLFAECLREALKQRDLEKSLIAERLRDRLDVDSMNLMEKFCRDGVDFKPFGMKDCNADERRTAARLLDLDIIRCVTPKERGYHYEWTDYGKHCYHHPNLT